MKKYFNILLGLALLVILAGVTSCQDNTEWDDHYDESANRGELQCQLLNELDILGYTKMAKGFREAHLDTLLNSGLQFTILAVSNENFPTIPKTQLKQVMKNALYFGAKPFVTDSTKFSLGNEKNYFTFTLGEESISRIVTNIHGDEIIIQKNDQKIFNALVQEVDQLLSYNEDVLSFFSLKGMGNYSDQILDFFGTTKLDSAYNHISNYFYWDTLYYRDGTEQRLPVFEKGHVTLASVRQLMYKPLPQYKKMVSMDEDAIEEVILPVRGEKLEFLMVGNLRSKLHKLYAAYQSDKAVAYFGGVKFDTIVEKEVCADSIIQFIAKEYVKDLNGTNDTIKFTYFKSDRPSAYPSKKFVFLKKNVDSILLTGGNKIYYVDSLLVTSKYQNLLNLDNLETDTKYVVRDTLMDVLDRFSWPYNNNTEDKAELVRLKSLDPSYPYYRVNPDPGQEATKFYSVFTNYILPSLSRKLSDDSKEPYSTIVMAGTRSNYTDELALKPAIYAKNYLEFKLDSQFLNTRTYKLRIAYSGLSKTGFSFLTKVCLGNDSLNCITLKPMKIHNFEDNTWEPISDFYVPEGDRTWVIADSMKNEIDLTMAFGDTDNDKRLEKTEPTKYNYVIEGKGELLTNKKMPFYFIEFEPFTVKSYNEAVYVRLVLNKKKPVYNTRDQKFFSLYKFEFEMIDE